jgi:hypothetical protein
MLFSKELDIEDIDASRINSFLNQVDYTLVYNTLPYLRLIKHHIRCSIKFLIVENEKTELLGVLPIALKKNDWGECIINSLPFYGSYGGLIVICKEDLKDQVRTLLLSNFNKIAAREKCIAYTLICNPLDSENDNWLMSRIEYDYIDKRIGQITRLPEDSNDAANQLLKSFEDPRPRNIRRAIKENVEVLVDNSIDNLRFLHEVHCQNISAINGKVKGIDFFNSIPKFFQDNEFKVYTALHNGKKIAALLLFYFNKTVEYFTPAIIEEYRQIQPTSLIIYRAMLDAIGSGYKFWNWGGTWLTQDGVYQFKKKWAAHDFIYHYYIKILDKKVFCKSKEELSLEFPNFYVYPYHLVKS